MFAFALLLTLQTPATSPDAAPPTERRGLLHSSDGARPGYKLFTPLRSTSTYLVDAAGKVAHEWTSDSTPGQSVYLLANGNLLRCERVPSDVFEGGGKGGRIREYDRDSKIVWEYVCADDTKLQHHDIEPLPNGNVLLIAWERVGREKALAAGRDPRLLRAGELWPDMVLEVQPMRPSGGKIVWEWHAWDHLVQDRDPKLAHYAEIASRPRRIDINATNREPEPTKEELEELEKLKKLGYVDDSAPRDAGRDGPSRDADVHHCNSIDYSPELDLIVLGSRELSELWFIDHSTTTAQAKGSSGGRWGVGGDLVFRFGNPRWSKAPGERALFFQHDAQWIPAGLPGAGHILLFNNGERGERERSTVDEFVISFTSEALVDFAKVEVKRVASYLSPDFCARISGAQRLANGNTLICAGETGRVVEVTPEQKVVWEYVNPHGGDALAGGSGRGERRGPPPDGGPPGGRGPGGGPMDARALFRAAHIDVDHPGLAKLKG